MTTLERVELAVRRAAATIDPLRETEAGRVLYALADELERVVKDEEMDKLLDQE